MERTDFESPLKHPYSEMGVMERQV